MKNKEIVYPYTEKEDENINKIFAMSEGDISTQSFFKGSAPDSFESIYETNEMQDEKSGERKSVAVRKEVNLRGGGPAARRQ